MNWVYDFYAKQAKWSGAYWGDVLDIHREKILVVKEFAGSENKRALELGAGGGQHAIALAELGYQVVAIEIVTDLAQHARKLAERHNNVDVEVVEGDFYSIEIPGTFDVVCYWDGFGIGTDDEQRQLLKRIRNWIKRKGHAFIDVYTPWHAAKSAGYSSRVGQARRRYDFDGEQSRWIDSWWLESNENQKITQSLRCYSPADLRLLLEGTGLALLQVIPGGMMNYESGRYVPKTTLDKAMWYTAVFTYP